MNRDGLLALYSYNAYAARIVFSIASQLTETQFTQRSSPSHNSVRELLIHMLESEAFFLSVCTGEIIEELPALQTAANIHDFWEILAKDTQEYIARLTDTELLQDVEIPIRGKVYYLPIWQALLQGFVHSTHHRGELSIVLTELGRPLPTLDILLQFIDQSGQQFS